MPTEEGNRQRQLLLDRMMNTDRLGGGTNPFAPPVSLAIGMPAPMFAARNHLRRLELAHAEANPLNQPNRTPSAATLERLGLGGEGGDGDGGGSDIDRLGQSFRDAAIHGFRNTDNRSKTLSGLPIFGAFNQQAALELVRAREGRANDRTPSAALLARINSSGSPGPGNLPPGAIDDPLSFAPQLNTNIPPDFRRKKRRGDDIFGAS